jgi:crotonobetainyl-CoA:carnitine CoA-transferase CaiB-like acyl-CoA transferase
LSTREPAEPTENAAELPLDGILILDFSQYLAGPSCTLRLADFGATVIKIERPQGGDACRALRIADQDFAGDSALFHTINRNKRSFAADLKDDADLRRVKALIARADVLVHNFRPGAMERLGLGYDELALAHPSLVYASVSGYGKEGPWRDRPGQDLLIQSLTGMSWLSGNADQGPVPIGISLADMAAGAHLAQGILAKLVGRARHGRGGRVQASLMESALDLQFEPFTAFLNGDGKAPRRSAVNHANIYIAAPYGIYRTGDGHMALAMTPIDTLAGLLDCPALAPYADPSTWFAARDAIKAIVAAHLATAGTAHWLGLLEPAGVWCAPVLDWPALVEHDGFAALRMTQDIHLDAGADAMRTTRCPVRIDGHILRSSRAAPGLGADTAGLVREYALDQPSMEAP